MLPLQPNEVERLKALADLEVFGSPPEPQYDAICRTAQALFGVPIALVSLISETEQWFKGKCGLDAPGTPREVSFCTYTILSDKVMVVDDATYDERFAANPLVTGEPHIRFYAGAPLVLRPGIHLGSLCIIDLVPRSFSREQQEQLRNLAQVIVALLRSGRAERDARESAAAYRLLADNSTDVIIRSDLDGTRRYVSPAARRLLGYEPRELLGTHPLAFVHPDEASAYARLLKQLGIGQLTEAVTQRRYRRRDGTWVWVEISFSVTREEETGEPNGYVAAIRDISQRKQIEREMAHLAHHDPLTGLPNRLHFRGRLAQELARTKRNGTGFALLCLDLDRFKLVNDTLGHQAGDTLLTVVAQRIKSVLRTEDAVARLGGDEFVIIQTGQGRAEDASRLAERLIGTMAAPVDLSGYPAGVGVSIGIALSPQDGLDPDHLYARADQALYCAKEAGRNTFRLYSEDEADSARILRQGGEREERSAEAIRLQEERYRLAMRATEDAIWDWDLTSDTITWNEKAYWLFGYSDTETVGTGDWWKSKIHPDDRERVTASIHRVIDGQEHRWSEEYRFEQGDGNYAEVLDLGFVIRDVQGRAVRMVGAMHDVTEQRRADVALRASEKRLRLALQAGRMVAWERNLKTDHSTRSENALELFGIRSGPTSQFFDCVHPDDRERIERLIQQGSQSREQLEFRYIHPTGRLIWLSAAVERVDEDRIVGITFDITERKLAEEQAWRAANHDALTGLPNRRLFHQRLVQALAAAERGDTSVSLLLLDLDMLRDVNDTLGHDAGDAVLCEAARRLSKGLRETDTVARHGGDEFALVLTEPLRIEHAAKHAEVLLDRLRQPHAYRGHALTCKASIGLAASPDHHRNTYDLLKDADIALCRAKVQGRNRAVVFAPEMRVETERRVLIATEIRVAVAAGQIVPYYQPKVCFATGAIVGFEALARWQHPERGLLTPGYFGSAFEDPELATAIGDSLIRQVAADLSEWRRCDLNPGRVAVNFASTEFRKPDLAGDILAVLSEHNVPPSLFEVEVTETVFLGYGSQVVPAMLQRLHDSGILVTLDDFGTGFASLTHLKQFPVGHIKVDQSFVRNVVADEGDAAIVAGVISLGRSLGMQVTAEGVETAGQAERLSAMGCNYAQGYLYAKPMAGSRVPWFLQNWNAEAVASSQVLRPV